MDALDIKILSHDEFEPENDGDARSANGEIKIQIQDNLTLCGKVRRFTVEAVCKVLIIEDRSDHNWKLDSMTVERYDFKNFDKQDTSITAEEESILANHLDSTYDEQYHQLEVLIQEDIKM